ncbi:hypothetical protein GUJ93_ZPchr0015g6999 [Zizania palustris]|uniref:Uncharacterized protein n=1 Tax=Zizania palustris TaxID=103762 RepID=A0A8J5W707_ZIZPA|nr:hypothetical protein GUJ93_ZPchr0015g6999 [Zizania palustris]
MMMLTVREAVHYSAKLQLPSAMSAATKRERAEETLWEMGLEGAADTRIDGTAEVSVWGGRQRKGNTDGMRIAESGRKASSMSGVEGESEAWGVGPMVLPRGGHHHRRRGMRPAAIDGARS